ncbi:hypothetical protein N0V84_004256 [Fusarium piperis]|uniref:F-box domain-containing protein n=1 Tax=Fusarium piperis TaxID=1435070 RepID=A0A9W8WFY5_9HYPO|nr:hypothetical protein N0V84_004256 [Fusarium piperis]
MDRDPNYNSAFLVKIPIEIISYTLSFMPDKKSLLNTILTCRVLNNAYSQRKAYIMTSILFSHMHESVYQEAIVFHRIKREQWNGARAGVRAVHRAFDPDRTIDQGQLPPHKRISLTEIELLHLFHEGVEWWANRIATNLKRNHSVLNTNPSPFVLTPDIMNRFKRAIYRLYMYIDILEKTIATGCADNGGFNRPVTDREREEANWCPLLDHLEEHRIQRAFYSHYSTAEIEQMMNICELIVTEIAPELNSYIQYDIELGSILPNFVDQPKFGMPMVVQGLQFMRTFVTARSYYQRRRLMTDVNLADWIPEHTIRAQFPSQDEKLIYDILHCGLGADDLKELENEPDPLWVSRKPFYDDGDNGPQLAWRKFNHHIGLFGGDNYNSDLQCRPWGYVFWSQSMLEGAGFMATRDDGTVDLRPPISPYHRFYRPQPYAYARWRTCHAARWASLARHVKRYLRTMWGRYGWFNADEFIADHLVRQLLSFSGYEFTIAQWESLFQEILYRYTYNYCSNYPHNYLMAPL